MYNFCSSTWLLWKPRQQFSSCFAIEVTAVVVPFTREISLEWLIKCQNHSENEWQSDCKRTRCFRCGSQTVEELIVSGETRQVTVMDTSVDIRYGPLARQYQSSSLHKVWLCKPLSVRGRRPDIFIIWAEN